MNASIIQSKQIVVELYEGKQTIEFKETISNTFLKTVMDAEAVLYKIEPDYPYD